MKTLLKNLNKKIMKWENENYLGSMKMLMGIILAFPTLGLFGIFYGYATSDIWRVIFGSVITVGGSVFATLFAITLYNEVDDARRESMRRHPVNQIWN